MKTADFVMDYESVTILAKEITQAQADFENLLVNLDSLVETMSGRWKGKAQVEFATAYSDLKPKLEIVSTVLENYATALSAAVSNEASLEEAGVNTYSNMGIPSF